MTFNEIYQHAWFANLAYVKWDIDSTNLPDKMQTAATEAERTPSKLGKKRPPGIGVGPS